MFNRLLTIGAPSNGCSLYGLGAGIGGPVGGWINDVFGWCAQYRGLLEVYTVS